MRAFSSLFGPAFLSGTAVAVLLALASVLFGTRAHAHEPIPLSILCDNQLQLDILVLARRGGLDEVNAINRINAGHSPVCVRMRKHIPLFDPPLKRLLIGSRIYEVHGLSWLEPTFDGLRFEYRVALVPAREYGI